MTQQFEVTLRSTSYFLGIELQQIDDGFFKVAKEICHRHSKAIQDRIVEFGSPKIDWPSKQS